MSHGSKMARGLGIKNYLVEMGSEGEAFIAYLKERNPKMAEGVEKQIEENCFLLANQYDDIWFWEFELINNFYGDLLEQIFNFY